MSAKALERRLHVMKQNKKREEGKKKEKRERARLG